MLHAVMKILWAQKWQLLPVAKIKGKTCFRWSTFTMITSQLTNHKWLKRD